MTIEALEEAYRTFTEESSGWAWERRAARLIRSAINSLIVRNTGTALIEAGKALSIEKGNALPDKRAISDIYLLIEKEVEQMTREPVKSIARIPTRRKAARFLTEEERLHFRACLKAVGTASLSAEVGIEKGLLCSVSTGRRDLLPQHIEKVMRLKVEDLIRVRPVTKRERMELPTHLVTRPASSGGQPAPWGNTSFEEAVRRIVKEELTCLGLVQPETKL